MATYLWWLPATVLFYSVFAWLSVQSNERHGWWPWVLYLYGASCPIWVLVSMRSKRLLFDGMVYDNLMFLSFVVTLLLLGAHTVSGWQWVGLVLVVLGSVLMRVAW